MGREDLHCFHRLPDQGFVPLGDLRGSAGKQRFRFLEPSGDRQVRLLGLQQLDAPRLEGSHLFVDGHELILIGQDALTTFLNFLEECVGRVETLSAGRVEAYTNRLYEKLKVILEDRDIDDARVLTEAAIFGDKTAVDEETVRLRSHIAQYRDILQLDEPVGRKLDFLTQELNRETNTIGSKCQDLDITRIVVDMKAEIEKIREQIQNLE